MQSVIIAENISKRYRIGAAEERYDTFAGQIVGMLKAPFKNFSDLKKLSKFGIDDETVFWALKDINFEVQQGEVLGIIGHNGAGKSTLLKILSRITEPTSGSITIRGRVSSLLEVGTGFHPDLTGRDNIYMNGTLLGMTKKEIDNRLEEIIEFSGISQHIDTPVKRYSSGMTVRLAFSVAAHLEPEILIIDEVLAVGDADFQKKSLGKMKEVSGAGRTVILVSHNMSSIKSLADRCVNLKSGRIYYSGDVTTAISKYFENREEIKNKNYNGFWLHSIVLDSDAILSGSDLQVILNYGLEAGVILRSLVIILSNALGERIAILDIREHLKNEFTSLTFILHNLQLVEGAYFIGLYYETNIEFGDLVFVKEFNVSEEVNSIQLRYDKSVRGVINVNYTLK